ncbi:MAG TPA: MBL fold metallo-hydrolase [Negativicutes bacterium]|jgi:glyoxylase-like metal-dependent hydrolase (beta-lactamase superfamily II)
MVVKDVSKVGNRGAIFTFEDDITVYLIDTAKNWFLCDTHLGPQSMECIKNYISLQANKKEVIVFNSHSDWDHIWGNCAFQSGIIIGHETCRQRMNEIGQFDLARLPEYHRGTIELVLPNLTFSDRITFVEADIEFIYAPGHTIDSSVCFDRKDSVLFVGDLVEYPIPYLDFSDLEAYIKTLDFIKNFPAKVKVSSHSGIIDNTLIDRNITYIKDIIKGSSIDPIVYQECPEVHNFNINNRLFLKYENMVREELKDNFDYTLFKNNFEDLKKVSYTDLQEALELYFMHL